MRLVYVIPLVVFATVAAAFGVGLTLKPNVVPSALIDKPVPEFTLAGLPGDGVESGKGFSSADLTGRVSIVNVFASWCFPGPERCVQVSGLRHQVAQRRQAV
ncbi:MAG: hypothetical protein ACE10M_08905 [Alphaproteobacteria bacterium]